MRDRLCQDLMRLMRLPGLSGHEERVRADLRAVLAGLGVAVRGDAMGNLVASFPGTGPRVMLFAHMDQMGFVVRKVEARGLLRLERLGGVPERALAAQEVLVCGAEGRDLPGVIANKAHHATLPEEKHKVLPVGDVFVDCGFASADAAAAAGVRIGVPVVYAPRARMLGETQVMGTSVDDRAGCAVLLEVARALARREGGVPVDLCFTVQEEFNLRGALPLAQALAPDIAIQLDLMLACDTPDMATRGEMALGGGPGLSHYSFHGRGTLNGVIPHPALVALIEAAAEAAGTGLQRSAQTGVLTDLSYVQHVGHGVAAADLGFPMRYSHSAREVCDLRDLEGLVRLLLAVLDRIGPDFRVERV